MGFLGGGSEDVKAELMVSRVHVLGVLRIGFESVFYNSMIVVPRREFRYDCLTVSRVHVFGI